MLPNEIRQTCYRRRAEASRYLKDRWGLDYKATTLAKLASVGGGPRYQTAGRFPIYGEDELDSWAAARFSPLKASTSDAGKQ